MPREAGQDLVCARFIDELPIKSGRTKLNGNTMQVEAYVNELFGEIFTTVVLDYRDNQEVWGFDEVDGHLDVVLERDSPRGSLLLLPNRTIRNKWEGTVARLALPKRAQRPGQALIKSGNIILPESHVVEAPGNPFKSCQEVIDVAETLAQALRHLEPKRVIISA